MYILCISTSTVALRGMQNHFTFLMTISKMPVTKTNRFATVDGKIVHNLCDSVTPRVNLSFNLHPNLDPIRWKDFSTEQVPTPPSDRTESSQAHLKNYQQPFCPRVRTTPARVDDIPEGAIELIKSWNYTSSFAACQCTRAPGRNSALGSFTSREDRSLHI